MTKKLTHLALCSTMIISFQIISSSRIQSTDERFLAYKLRALTAMNVDMLHVPTNIENLNTDEQTVPYYAGTFSKSLDHDVITSAPSAIGLPNVIQYIYAMNTGNQADFNAIQRAAGALPNNTGQLTDPQAALAWSMMGIDSSLTLATPPPLFASDWRAGEMLENYWLVICRDVFFSDYGTGLNTDSNGLGGSLTNQAAQVLSTLGPTAYKGPLNSLGQVDATVLFRGTAAGCLVGPYISQFLWQNFYLTSQLLAPLQQQEPVAQQREFGVKWTDFIAIENGQVPQPYLASDFVGKRYMVDGRDLGTYVHHDNTYEPYFNAANILITNGFPFSPYLPYYNGSMRNECAFTTMGIPDVLAQIGTVSNLALKAAWANKWRAWRILRPEEFGGLVNYTLVSGTNPFGISPVMFALHAGINTLAIVQARNGLQAAYNSGDPATLYQTYLLAQEYPEGSPSHPSYPSGHATVAGACTTILKAYFDETTLISAHMTLVQPNLANPTTLASYTGSIAASLTVGGELDKLASNIAIARNFAGVHWRSDADYGNNLGETIAIEYLQEQAALYSEQNFTGFVLTKRNGQRIQITATGVVNL